MKADTFVALISGAARAAVALARHAGRRLRRPLMIALSSIVLLMLLIVILQSGLGVDSDDTITDSQRPEIVGGD